MAGEVEKGGLLKGVCFRRGEKTVWGRKILPQPSLSCGGKSFVVVLSCGKWRKRKSPFTLLFSSTSYQSETGKKERNKAAKKEEEEEEKKEEEGGDLPLFPTHVSSQRASQHGEGERRKGGRRVEKV